MRNPYIRHCLAAFFLDCAIMAGATAMPFFIYHELGGAARMSGMIAALQSGLYGVGSVISSTFVARAKNGLRWAYLGTACYALLFSIAPVFRNPYLYAVVSMLGFGSLAFVWPAMWSWLGAEPDPERRSRRMAYYNLSWSGGLAIGPLLAGPLYDLDYRLPFVLVFTLAGLSLLLQITLPHEKKHIVEPDEATERTGAKDVAASETYLYAAWFANFIGWILVGASRSVFPKRVDELAAAGQLAWLWDASPAIVPAIAGATVFSWLAFSMNASRAGGFFLMGHTHRWQYKLWPILVAQAAAVAAYWLMASTQSILLMAACFIILGLNGGLAFCSAAFYGMMDRRKKHQRAAVNEGAVGTGSFVGSMGFGLLAGWLGVTVAFRWAPLLLLVAFPIQWALLAYGHRKARRIV